MKKKVGYEFVEGDIHWENKIIIPMVSIAIVGEFKDC